MEDAEAETTYLRIIDVIALHRAVMLRLRRTPEGIRDESALESAVTRPRMVAHYESADLTRQATVLAIGISQAKAFVDGNKRTAYAALDTFLRLNERAFAGRPLDLAHQLEAVASRNDSLDAATDRFEAWLREQVGPRSSD
jgi:death-on-curing protein